MAGKRRGKWLAGLGGALLGIWGTGSGCQSTGLPPARPAAPVVRMGSPVAQAPSEQPDFRPAAGIRRVAYVPGQIEPRTELHWSVESPQLRPSGVMGDISVVGPDGTMAIGPYGSVHVAGLTAGQAQAAVERHLRHYLTRPRVKLQVGGNDGGGLAWRTAQRQPASTDPGAASSWRPAVRPASPPRSVRAAGWWNRPSTSQGPDAGVQTAMIRPYQSPRSAAQGEFQAPPPQLTPEPPVALPEGAASDPLLNPHVLAGPAGGPIPNGPPPPTELGKRSLPRYVVEPPDILLIETRHVLRREQPIGGTHLVRPDGTVSLGIYGTVYVAGMTLEQIQEAVAEVLRKRLKKTAKEVPTNDINVDVVAYNSKVYYIITDGAGYGEQVQRVPVTGSETVLDALSYINGLPPVADKKKIWVARRHPGGYHGDQILPVDWIGITQHGATATNYQVLPGDRIYVKADRWRSADTFIAKVLSPIERLFGVTLLASQTVNSIKSGSTSGGVGR
jgi:polysaccharide export outer membrane protein